MIYYKENKALLIKLDGKCRSYKHLIKNIETQFLLNVMIFFCYEHFIKAIIFEINNRKKLPQE